MITEAPFIGRMTPLQPVKVTSWDESSSLKEEEEEKKEEEEEE
jgi:hypothetical protein